MKEIKTVCRKTAEGFDKEVNGYLSAGWTLTWRGVTADGFLVAGLERSLIAPNMEPKNETEPERCGAIYHNRPRPCMVVLKKRNGEIFKQQNALFHGLYMCAEVKAPSPLKGGHPGGTVAEPVAVVEFEDGTVRKCLPEFIRLLDSAELFYWYDWEVQE